MRDSLSITGIASVSPYGVFRGPIRRYPLEPRERPGVRGYLVEPFRPGDFVRGLQTRRMDRLSVWALVAASLAIEDATLDLSRMDRSRMAVVFGTGYGCLDLTEAYFQSMADHGNAETDPILFPETLANTPAGHIARVLGITGPNLTCASRGASGETALTQAAAVLRCGMADRALVVAGDVLSRTLFEWYRAAATEEVPGEGLAALVLDQSASGRVYRCGGEVTLPFDFDSVGVLRLVAALS